MGLAEEYKLVSKHKFIHTCTNCGFSSNIANLRCHLVDVVEKIPAADSVQLVMELTKKSLWERIKCFLSR